MLPDSIIPLLPISQRLPLYSTRVPAGHPDPAQDHLDRETSLDELLNIHAPATYLLRVAGDSMQGAGIFDGDLLIVDRSLEARPGDIIIAALNGEATIKRLCREHNQLVLRPENPRYRPLYILEGDDFAIWGVVRFSVRRHGAGLGQP